MITFTLDWPHRELSPNSRAHWSKKARHTKQARADAYVMTQMVMRNRSPLTWSTVGVHLNFVVPNLIKRDGHNLAASMKGAIDGIADAVGIDDSRFQVSHELSPPERTAPYGVVRVTLTEHHAQVAA